MTKFMLIKTKKTTLFWEGRYIRMMDQIVKFKPQYKYQKIFLIFIGLLVLLFSSTFITLLYSEGSFNDQFIGELATAIYFILIFPMLQIDHVLGMELGMNIFVLFFINQLIIAILLFFIFRFIKMKIIRGR